jgi:hypothetical protein
MDPAVAVTSGDVDAARLQVDTATQEARRRCEHVVRRAAEESGAATGGAPDGVRLVGDDEVDAVVDE